MEHGFIIEHAMSIEGINNGTIEAETANNAQLVQVSATKKKYRSGKKAQAELAKRLNAQLAPTGTGKFGGITVFLQAD